MLHGLRFVFLSLLLTSLLVGTGCKPDKEGAPPQPEKTDVDSAAKTDEPVTADQPGAINGPLDSVDWDSLVGQEVTIGGDLVIVDTYDLVRRGQIKVARDRIYIPTNQIDPNDADPDGNSFEGGSNVGSIAKARRANDRGTLILDDGSDEQNIFPPKLFPNLGQSLPTVRIGSVLNGLSGTLTKDGGKLLLVPTAPLEWTPADRPQRPDVGEANVTVASFNVLNYFTTIDDGRNRARGADSKSELTRQEAKLVSTMVALEADVIGLMELENNLEAENRLVAALNQKFGEPVFKGCGLPAGFNNAPGGDNAIRVGIIYRSDRVTPIKEVEMIRDEAFKVARTPIVQSFKPKSAGKPFTVIVNHFKSKGGSQDADAANKDKGDGQGGYNATRRSQSLAICDYLAGLEENPRVLVIGDLNAYGQEDPIDALRAKGLVDLQDRVGQSPTGTHYSFIYYGQSGSLDHAMATKALAEDVTGIATWHINADEPRFLDYNQEYNPKTLYEANPFRSSDHDPVLIGIGN